MRPVATHAAWSVCPPSAEQREAVAAPAEGGPPARRKTDNITPISDQTTSRLAVTLILTLLILTLIPVTLNLVPSGAGALLRGFPDPPPTPAEGGPRPVSYTHLTLPTIYSV